jgi:hypothetical protein
VQSEGGEEARGFPQARSNGITTITATTRRPILSLRPKATYNSLTNRAHLNLAEIALTAQTNPSYWEMVIGGTLTAGGGAATWVDNGSASAAEYNIDADAITGGVTVYAGFVIAAAGTTKGGTAGELDLRGSLTLSQINALTATQPIISLVCTSFGGNSLISGMLHWHELVI